MNADRIREIRERADAVADWVVHGVPFSPNGGFIAHARTDIEDLLAEREGLRALIRYFVQYAADQGADIGYLSEDEAFNAELCAEVTDDE